jgi:hypothetical protein
LDVLVDVLMLKLRGVGNGEQVGCEVDGEGGANEEIRLRLGGHLPSDQGDQQQGRPYGAHLSIPLLETKTFF